MAKRVINDVLYTFNPTTRTIVIPRYIPRERLLLITNNTTNQVIFNFSDPTLTATSYTTTGVSSAGGATTTLVLSYNTASMSSTDDLAIVVDEIDQQIEPVESYADPVNKMRVSTPQSLIDTDFEYSRQDTKWESLAAINYRPFGYANNSAPLTISTLTTSANGSRTVIMTPNNSLAVGQPIVLYDTGWGAGTDGMFMIESVNSTAAVFSARYAYPNYSSNNIIGLGAVGFAGAAFTGSTIGISSITYSGAAITVTTTTAHGLNVGNEIYLFGTSASTNAPNGTWYVTTVTSDTVFTFYASATPTGSITGGTLYPRPTGFVNHRAFDGGVLFSTFSQSHGQQLIRQTRRYFRYQSGKGIQLSTGSILRPELTIDNLTASGNVVTVTTRNAHNIFSNTLITVSGAQDNAYNGSYNINQILTPYQFTYVSNSVITTTPAEGDYRLSVNFWYGAGARIGLFDDQNGLFFEYDGTTLYAVRRSATYQLSGQATVTNGSSTVTGITNIGGGTTRFGRQLVPGDTIVIRGMTYKVMTVSSDTSMTITPAYKGTTVSSPAGVTITKVIDTKIPQSQWNIDRCDGTGPSGYNLDLSRMQMFYIDYSWYGAGFIRWGFRGNDGNIFYAHKMINNNVNFEAYMRSGNLPARYETHTHPMYTELTTTLGASDTTMAVANVQFWPTSGTVWVRNGTQSEFIGYSGRSNTALLNLTRTASGNTISINTTTGSPVVTTTSTVGLQVGQYAIGSGIPVGSYIASFVPNTSITISQAALATASGVSTIFAPLGATTPQAFSYSTTTPVNVQLHSPSFSPTISHWGTSVIMDGRFDDDKSFVFTNGMTSALTISAGATNALMSFRVSPTVSNGIAGSGFGSREIINRMQMVLRELGLLSGGQFLITLVLNGVLSSATPNWTNVGGSSLAQYINHSAGTTITGGETIYGFYTNSSGGSTNLTTTSQDLPLVRDLGNSIVGGGVAAATSGFYPDGPDIVTVMARNVSASSATIFGRMSWTEAQA